MRFSSVFFVGVFVLAQSVFASSYLVVAGKPGKYKPDLAKQFKANGSGKMEFTLDTSKTLEKTDVKVSFDIVKASLERGLGKTFGVTVSGDEKSTLVQYTGSSEEFLKALAKTKIKASAAEVVVMDGSASDTGVRAKDKADREPSVDEVRGTVIKVDSEYMTVNVDAKGTSELANKVNNGKVKVAPVQEGYTPKKRIYFIPKSIENGIVKISSAKSE